MKQLPPQPAAGPRRLTSLTAVCVVRHACPTVELTGALLDALAERAQDANLILVANSVSADTALSLKALATSLPDVTVLFLGELQHDDTCRLLGIEQAIGDYILLCTPTVAEIHDLDLVLAPLAEGYELVTGARPERVGAVRNPLESALFELFRGAFWLASGMTYSREAPGMRVLSRAAALHLLSRRAAEVRVRAPELENGFPTAVVLLPSAPTHATPRLSLRASISRAIRLLLTSSSLPMRAASLLGVAGGVGSLVYMIYVLVTWLVKPDIAPGWTTLSLQVSGMCFLFSVLFLLISEYLVQILSVLPVRSRRHLVTREITSQLSRRDGRVNVLEAGAGEFQLGMPAAYARASQREPAE